MGLDLGAALGGQLGGLGGWGTCGAEALYIVLRNGEHPPFEIEMFERQYCPFSPYRPVSVLFFRDFPVLASSNATLLGHQLKMKM